ncbi:MAG: hypothetical protein GKR94_01000 [Gammaproteobacteria bacterium]|nr:hypothetical protein [Gammaproteobacteria bacterium]
MTRTIENIYAAKISRVLAEKEILPDKAVTGVLDEEMADIARRMRDTAKARGMTEALFDELTKDL